MITSFKVFRITLSFCRSFRTRLILLSTCRPCQTFPAGPACWCGSNSRNQCRRWRVYRTSVRQLNLPSRTDNWQRRIWSRRRRVQANRVSCSKFNFEFCTGSRSKRACARLLICVIFIFFFSFITQNRVPTFISSTTIGHL